MTAQWAPRTKPGRPAHPIPTDAERRTLFVLLAMIAGVAAMQLHHVFVQGINWDEFFYYSHVYDLHRGALTRVLQTIHARLFAWLPLVPGREVEELRAARLVMLGCELITVAGVVAVARHFTSPAAAMIAGLAYIGGGFVFQHGFSFRADTIAAAVLMSALWLALRSNLSPSKCVSIAALIALAGMVTVKSVFYAPAFIGIAIYRLAGAEEIGRRTGVLVATGLLSMLLFALMYALHASGLPEAGLGNSRAILGSASEKMFSMGSFPRLNYILKQALLAPVLTMIILAAPFAINGADRKLPEKVALAGLFLPIATLLIYRNSFPYYYAFMLPPVVAASAVVLPTLIRRYGALPLGALAFANAVFIYASMPKNMQRVQKDVLTAAHLVFPRPVAYFDFCSMLPSFPKRGFFMSGWGTESYREGGRPVFKTILAGEPVPLLVANHAGLLAALGGADTEDRLLPEDEAILRNNYVHHWGPLWVAGKRVRAGADQTLEVVIEGPYTVEQQPITVDGRAMGVGEAIWLARGRHSVSGPRAGEAVLRWGRSLPKPAFPEPEPGVFGIFTDF